MEASALESAATALESAIQSLESQAGSLSCWLHFWEIVVVIGVAVEAAVVIKEYRAESRAHIRATIVLPPKPRILDLFFNLLGAGLVAVGLLGEVGVDFKASVIESELRTDTEKLVGLLNVEAGDTRQKAGEAEERAAKLEASMMLRSLSKEQSEALCKAIPKDLLPQVVVTSSSQDWESFRYAMDFNEALRTCRVAAGIDPGSGVGNSFWAQNVRFGVWIRYPKHFTLDDPKSTDVPFNPERRRLLAKSVRQALIKSGVKAEGILDEGRGLVDIYVGPRFPPAIEETEKDRKNNTQ